MTVVVHLALGVAAGWLWWIALRPVLAMPALARSNYRGAPVPTAGGLAVVLASVTVVAAASVAIAAGWLTDGVDGTSRAAAVVAALGFGLLGFLDDALARGSGGGFRSHLGALAHGRATTGNVKLVGGALVAVVVVLAAGVDGQSVGWMLVDAAVVALAANLANLLDRAPGRATKASVVALAVLAVVTGLDIGLAGPAVVAGGALALLVPELREQVMLGDMGANVLGGAAGLATVLTLGHGAVVAVLVALVAVNALSEFVSFSAVIDRTPLLRWADRLGSRRPA